MSATITITLPAELERAISAKASANGQKLEDYLLQIIQKDAERPSLREIFADVHAYIEARGITDEELEADINAALAEVRAARL
jgi:hypothetical protein